jgi:hypothetical protein
MRHIPDWELLLAAEEELAEDRLGEIHRHLGECPSCRLRHAGLERTMAEVVAAQRELDGALPPIEVSRASLGTRLTEPPRRRWLAYVAAVLLVAGMGALLANWPGRRGEFAPNAAWTPGSVRPITREATCSNRSREDDGHPISPAVAQDVFRRYGIRNPRPRTYQVDYLIPAALGGSDDPRNLWPEPYSAGVWNARVKDALEDRLLTMVCEGTLDLATAQRDLARDWIAAYKKYFRTAAPLVSHAAFVKDRPWE